MIKIHLLEDEKTPVSIAIYKSTPMSATQINLNGTMSGNMHVYPLIVQYEDTDAGGVVYHSNYLNYAERGRSAFLRTIGIDLHHYLKEERKTILISNIQVDYLTSARLNQCLIVETTVTNIGKVRLNLEQIIKNEEDGHIFARLQVQAVWVELDKGARRLPDFMREKLKIAEVEK